MFEILLPHDRRNFVHKRISGAVRGFVSSGFNPLGALGGFASGGGSSRNAGPTTTRRGKGSRSRRRSRAANRNLARSSPFQVTDVPGIRGALQRAIPFGATGLQVQAPLGVGVAVTGGCPSGFHPNKSNYYRGDGAGGVVQVLKGTMCVRNRRMNALNPRAATRSIARVGAGKRASAVFNRITIRKKKDC